MSRRDAETQREKEISSSASLRLGGETNWLLWQLADSAFPTGGFAHSGGLEAAWQHHEVRGGAALSAYLETALKQLLRNAMPFAAGAFHGTLDFSKIDQRCDAFLSNHVANRSSRAQGQSFLSSADRIFQSPEVREFRDELLEKSYPGHLAPVFGRTSALLKVDEISTARLFVFTQVRGWISAAVRLNIVGPLEGQTIQHRLAGAAEAAAVRFGEVTMEDAAQTAPLLDLWQGTQDRLYSRLFQT